MTNRIEITREMAEEGATMERALREAERTRGGLLLPLVEAGDTFTVDGRRYTVTQVCGETCYLKPGAAPWDFAAPTRKVAAVLALYGNGKPAAEARARLRGPRTY